jgi:hypothetical protein
VSYHLARSNSRQPSCKQNFAPCPQSTEYTDLVN